MPGIGTMERDAPHYWGLLDPRYSKDFVWSFSKYVIVSEADARFHWYFDVGLTSPGK